MKNSVFVWISVDGRPNLGNKAAFSNFFLCILCNVLISACGPVCCLIVVV